MPVVDIEITNHCQARCPVCPRTDALSNPDDPRPWSWLKLEHAPTASVVNRINSLRHVEDLHIKFCGEWGDPLMHPDLLDMVQAAVDCGASVNINTNAALRNAAWWDSLRNTGCEVVFGIDGSVGNISELYRINTNGDAALRNMRDWFSGGGRGYWQYLAFAHNQHDWCTAVDAAVEWGVPMSFRQGNSTDGMMSWTQDHQQQYLEMKKYVRTKPGVHFESYP